MAESGEKRIKNELGEEELKSKARRVSIREGCFSAFSSGAGDNFIIPFAQELLAKPFIIGSLSAFPSLLSPIAQAFGSRLIETSSRKKIVVRFVLLQSLLWLPLAILAFLFYSSLWKEYLP